MFVICACAILSYKDVALVNSYSSQSPKLWVKLLNCLRSNLYRCETINVHMKTGSMQCQESFFCLKIVYTMRLACRHIIKHVKFDNHLTVALYWRIFKKRLISNLSFLYESHHLGNEKNFQISIPDTQLLMTCCINRHNSRQSQKEYLNFSLRALWMIV